MLQSTTHLRHRTPSPALLRSQASSADQVYKACLQYITAKTGASGYVAITDLPDKEVKIPEPESESPPAEGEEAQPGADEAEAPPKYNLTSLKYVAAASDADAKLLLGKTLARPAAAEGADEAAPIPRGDGEGVSFDAIDAFLANGTKCLLLPQAIINRSVKFWAVPRVGSLAIAPFADADGDVLGVIAADTLAGGELGASAGLDTLAAKASAALCRVAIEVAKGNVAAQAELSVAYEQSGEALAAELEAAAQAEEAGDKLTALKAKQRRAAGDLAALTSGHLAFLGTRKVIPAELLQVLKAVMALIAPDTAATLASMDWEALKAAAAAGSLPWGTDLFTKVGGYDVLGSKDEAGFAAATGETGYVSGDVDAEALKAFSFVGLLLLNWVRDTSALFSAKTGQEKADAEAAAEAAAEGEAAAEAAAAEAGEAEAAEAEAEAAEAEAEEAPAPEE